MNALLNLVTGLPGIHVSDNLVDGFCLMGDDIRKQLGFPTGEDGQID